MISVSHRTSLNEQDMQVSRLKHRPASLADIFFELTNQLYNNLMRSRLESPLIPISESPLPRSSHNRKARNISIPRQ